MEDGLQNPQWPFWVPGNVFWIDNVPATSQGYVNKILAKKLNIFVIVYLDDIFIYTESEGKK